MKKSANPAKGLALQACRFVMHIHYIISGLFNHHFINNTRLAVNLLGLGCPVWDFTLGEHACKSYPICNHPSFEGVYNMNSVWCEILKWS